MLPLHDNNPTRTRPVITIGLIVICVLVFIWQLAHPFSEQVAIAYSFGVTPAYLFGQQTIPAYLAKVPGWLTVLTYMFLHGGWMHLIGNMLYLWIFGNNIEDAMGHGRFVLFYILCGVAAVFANALPDIDSTTPMIGASGAISGVLGAYLLLYPRARVLIVVPLLFVFYSMWWPAWLVLVFWFLWQIISSLMFASTDGAGIAWGAHIGGFIAGMLLVGLFKYKHVRYFR